MLEQSLVTHGAATLAGLKAGSLFRAPSVDLAEDVARANKVLGPRGAAVTALRASAGEALVYLYRFQLLEETLQAPEIQRFLAACGYADRTLPGALATLRERLRTQDFPHEIGVFLGYPLADVLGFIANGGRNCLCAGPWKVYADPQSARRTFARLRKCQAVYAQLYAAGRPLERLVVKRPL